MSNNSENKFFINPKSALIVGLIILSLGIFAVIHDKTSNTIYEDLTATIVDIDKRLVSDGPNDNHYEYTVYVDYAVYGERYEHVEYGAYDSKMKVGDKVTVYYDVSDPSIINAPGFENVPYIFIAVGTVITFIGVYLQNKKKKEDLTPGDDSFFDEQNSPENQYTEE